MHSEASKDSDNIEGTIYISVNYVYYVCVLLVPLGLATECKKGEKELNPVKISSDRYYLVVVEVRVPTFKVLASKSFTIVLRGVPSVVGVGHEPIDLGGTEPCYEEGEKSKNNSVQTSYIT